MAVLGGARVGPDTVDLIGCVSPTERITTDGLNIAYHGTTTSIRPSLRRAVLARDDGCTIDGCTSAYRLEVHHITPVSQGGTHTADNLATLCWFHHHVAVHRRGMRIDPQSPPRRRRLLPARARTCGYRPPDPDPTPSPSSTPYTRPPTAPHPDPAADARAVRTSRPTQAQQTCRP